jgi:hypothetical protein
MGGLPRLDGCPSAPGAPHIVRVRHPGSLGSAVAEWTGENRNGMCVAALDEVVQILVLVSQAYE